jgi:voltage-gated potassium channel
MLREYTKILIVVSIIFLGGTLGYYIIEDWTLLESLYMTIITVSTTGYQEIKPLSLPGRMFTMVLIIAGISILFYALGRLNIALFESNFFRERKMKNKIDSISDHYIICGFGRMGAKIAAELEGRNEKFVIIEKDAAAQDTMEEKKYLYLAGDATEDATLINAGIKKARGFVAVLSSDVENVFATLSARGLNPGLKIIARAEEESSREKLLKAGATKVILPYEIGGFRITQALLKPAVLDYFDNIFSRTDIGLEIEELKIPQNSHLVGRKLSQSEIRSKLNIIIIAIYRHDGSFIYNPGGETMLEAGDQMIVIGKATELQKFQETSLR